MLLATFGRERRPRCVRRAEWDWAKAWAKRWWLVEAESADQARELIGRANGDGWSGPAPAGRIVDCGRHGPGGSRPVTAMKHSKPRSREVRRSA